VHVRRAVGLTSALTCRARLFDRTLVAGHRTLRYVPGALQGFTVNQNADLPEVAVWSPARSTFSYPRLVLAVVMALGLLVVGKAAPGFAGVHRPAAAVTQAACITDDGDVVKMCLTMHYQQATVNGDKSVEVDSYTYSFKRLDSSFAFVSSNIHMGVEGRCDKACGSTEFLSSIGDCNKSLPGGSVQYTCTPAWAGKYVDVAPQGLAGQAANETLVMSRGSKKYTFFNEGVQEGSFDVPGPA
jgi:hypothetical protein